jgi:hypothetical protein
MPRKRSYILHNFSFGPSALVGSNPQVKALEPDLTQKTNTLQLGYAKLN